MANRDLFHFAGLPIQRWAMSDSLAAVSEEMQHCSLRVFFVNAHCVAVASRNNVYLNAMQQAEFVFNDGAAIELASKILALPVKENLNGTDWIPAFFDHLADAGKHYKVFYLGSKPEVVQGKETFLAERWPNFVSVGCQHGYFSDDEEVLRDIEEAKPDILLLGMGVPKQELFLDTHWARLVACGVRLGIGGGAIFDFLTGEVPRAPLWMRTLRLEWLYRIWIEPRRLARRYLFDMPPFVWHLVKAWSSRRLFAKGPKKDIEDDYR